MKSRKGICSSNNPNLISLEELAEILVESFERLNPAEQEQVRKKIYAKVTGKPYRKGNTWTN